VVAAAAGSREPETRQRLIDAAVTCILEQGFYRASTNAIAERAGLTWGVIQYYFGTRENLMLAVLEHAASRLQDTLSAAAVDAPSLAGRLEQFFDILAAYYGQPSFVAFTEVQLNLSHDPRTSARTHENLLRINVPVRTELDRLMSQVLAGGADAPEIRSLIFHVLRGLSISEVMLGTQGFDDVTAPKFNYLPEHPKLLAQALSLLIESRGN
jgi:TetR/AcrR family transcriptional regulator, regulator of cefoperazone and chloramphenicol sensitivity